MVFIDKDGNIRIKVVIYGPARSGKTTLIKRIVELGKEFWRAHVRSIEDIEGNTLFFDFAPFQYKNRPLALDMYTVPGKRIHLYQRETLLKGADVIIFVADYQEDRLDDNLASLEELERIVNSKIPVIIVLNKYDLVYRFPREKFIPKIPKNLNVKEILNTSAKLDYNVDKLFKYVIETALSNFAP